MELFKKYQKLMRYEHDRESLDFIAVEHGLENPDNEIIISHVRYLMSGIEESGYYQDYFEPDERNRVAYESEKKDFLQLRRFYNKYCR